MIPLQAKIRGWSIPKGIFVQFQRQFKSFRNICGHLDTYDFFHFMPNSSMVILSKQQLKDLGLML